MKVTVNNTLAVGLFTLLTACNMVEDTASVTAENLVGTWIITDSRVNSVQQKTCFTDPVETITTDSSYNYTDTTLRLILNADWTFLLSQPTGIEIGSINGTWSISDHTLIRIPADVSVAPDTATVDIRGNNLTVALHSRTEESYSGCKYVTNKSTSVTLTRR